MAIADAEEEPEASEKPDACTLTACELEDSEVVDQRVLALALPALVALCAEPALSVINLGFVGRLPDAALSIGGLGVATSVFDFVFRCPRGER